MYKASITAVLLALGIVFLVQAGSNAMVVPTAGLRPDLASPAIVETVALRRDGRVGRRGAAVGTRHATVRHRVVTVRIRHPTGPSLTASHWALSLPPLLCRRHRLSTCAGIGRIPPRFVAIGTSANSAIGSHVCRSSHAGGPSRNDACRDPGRGSELRISDVAAQTRMSLVARSARQRGSLSRHLKYMAGARIPEFESYVPSQAVVLSSPDT